MLDDFALLLVDDHPLFRDGLAAALSHQAPSLRVQAVGTLADALALLSAADDAFDLVLLDYCLPGMDGLHCAELLMQRHPSVGVGLMSGLDDPTLAARARNAGLSAYLPKSLELSVLLAHLERLAQGEPVFSAPSMSVLADAAPSAAAMGLTPRQIQVLQALASGGSNKDIARDLDISPATVKKHLESVFARMGAANRLQAVVMARAYFGEPRP